MKHFTKRALALGLSAVMAFSMIACGDKSDDKKNESTPTPLPTDAVPGGDGEQGDKRELWSVDYDKLTVNAGSLTANLGSAEGGTISYDVYQGVAGKDYTDEKYYTYHDYVSGMTDMKWSTHTWETNEDSYLLDLLTRGFYGFELNSTKNGWCITCEMAAELPKDVTADYVGKYGITKGETGKAWKIVLNPDATWENGTPINADSYMYSYKELLDPIMLNRRADSLYAGDFEIYNAKNYFYGGKTVMDANSADGETMTYQLADLVKGADGVYTAPDGTVVMFGLDQGYAWMQGDSLADYSAYFPEGVFDELVALADDKGYVPVTDKSIDLLYSFTGSDTWGNESKEDLAYYLSIQKSFDKLSFDEVGIFKTGEYEIVFVTTSPISQPEYYVPYNLSSVYLVYEPMWEECKTYWDASGKKVTADSANIANITTNYCTSKETTMSFGPYILDYFELDKQMTFKRNDNWYGYKDGKHKGQYQIDEISTQVIAEQATALLAFQKGEIDNTALVAENMSTYASSPYIRYTPQSYTTKLSFNTDLEKTTERGTQIMTNWKFRKAFAMAIDRSTFAASYTSAGSAGYGLLNYLYVYDPYSGATYRDTEGAMEALVQLNGLTYGEGGDYEDLEEAYDAITNYDMTLAKKLMKEAYDDCVKSGIYKDEEVKIQLRVYANDDVYVQMFNYLKGCLEEACKGSGFEGKVTMEMVVDADYYNTNYSGGADMIFTTWGGATYSPWTLLYECYCDAADGSGQQMEFGFDTSKINVTMKINDKDYTASLQTWALWCDGDQETKIKAADGTALEAFGAYDNETKAAIFGRLEYSYLSFFTTTPIYYRNTGSLVSQKGDYAVKEYIDLIGFGGLAFYTFEYDDVEWEKVKSDLNY